MAIKAMTTDDQSLRQIFTANGLALTVTEVRDLIAGIIAAPPSVSQEPEWLGLITPHPTPALRKTLLALYDKMREMECQDGLFPTYHAAAERLHALRVILRKRELDGFIIPRADEHQGEHVARHAERLNWLTGFTGSAGVAIVLQHTAALFVDSRYSLQAVAEVDGTLFEHHPFSKTAPAAWLATQAKPEQHIGYDPWLHTPVDIHYLEKTVTPASIQLRPCHQNPIDAIWHNQPRRPLAPAILYPLSYAGQSGYVKRCAIAEDLKKVRADATVLTTLDSIAWLLNIRGGDVPYSPLLLSFAILYTDASVDIFLDQRKITPAVTRHLGSAVRILPPQAFEGTLELLGKSGARVSLDINTIPIAVADHLRTANAHIISAPNPCALHQAQKNEVELKGMRAAHCRDGIALVRFLCWLEEMLANSSRVTELAAAAQLQALRHEGRHFRGLSFATISATGSNSAIVHYHATPATDKPLCSGTLYLIDSGAQYWDGTTDVTRTVAIGSVGIEMRQRFTQVLKGHIALATARFPVGTTGSQLDVLARLPLWAEGIDYDHGTGHGVGNYLNVHEGPHRISTHFSDIPLVPGMIVSDEPGYYKAGAYGIRIESLLAVCQVSPPPVGAERPLLAFEVLTLVPIDRTLIDLSLLSQSERMWVDSYHAYVNSMLSPLLNIKYAKWLAQATKPLGKNIKNAKS